MLENLEEFWPTLFKLLNHDDVTLRAASGATVASMFVHGGARRMEPAIPKILEMAVEFDPSVQLAVAPLLPFLAEVPSAVPHLMNQISSQQQSSFDTVSSMRHMMAGTSIGSLMTFEL